LFKQTVVQLEAIGRDFFKKHGIGVGEYKGYWHLTAWLGNGTITLTMMEYGLLETQPKTS
jgi:hypothetical protein